MVDLDRTSIQVIQIKAHSIHRITNRPLLRLLTKPVIDVRRIRRSLKNKTCSLCTTVLSVSAQMGLRRACRFFICGDKRCNRWMVILDLQHMPNVTQRSGGDRIQRHITRSVWTTVLWIRQHSQPPSGMADPKERTMYCNGKPCSARSALPLSHDMDENQ